MDIKTVYRFTSSRRVNRNRIRARFVVTCTLPFVSVLNVVNVHSLKYVRNVTSPYGNLVLVIEISVPHYFVDDLNVPTLTNNRVFICSV